MIENTRYTAIETQENVPFGSRSKKAIASWSDSYDIISAVEDDKCIIFVLHSTGKPLHWIPKEIIKSLVIPIETELALSVN